MTFLGPENFVRFEKHQKSFSGALRGASRAREVLGSFEKRTPGRSSRAELEHEKQADVSVQPTGQWMVRFSQSEGAPYYKL